MKPILFILLLFTCAPSLLGQDATSSTRPVVNADIIEMSRAGLLPSVVMAKIKNSECKFDTSPSALVALKEAGVADEVLMEMVRNPNGGAPPKTQSAPSSTPNVIVALRRQ